MEPHTALPDLSVVPPGAQREREEAAEKYDKMTEALEEAVTAEEMEREVPSLVGKAEEYARKVAEGDKERKEKKEKDVKAPVLPGQTVPPQRSSGTKGAVDEIIKNRYAAAKGKQKGKSASAARAALAMINSTATALAVKPLPKKKEGKEEEGEGKGKGKEMEGKDTDRTPTASFQGRDDDSAEGSTEKEQDDEKLWEDARASHSDEFPSVTAPGLSEEYREFSVASSHIEGLGADIQALSRQMTTIMSTVKEQNVQIATLQATVVKLEEDKSQFLSHTLDKIRQLERQMGNKPPIVASATSIAAPVTEAASDTKTSDKPPSSPMSAEEKQKRLAALKAQRNW